MHDFQSPLANTLSTLMADVVNTLLTAVCTQTGATGKSWAVDRSKKRFCK